jgi:FkbM family methyltransferase
MMKLPANRARALFETGKRIGVAAALKLNPSLSAALVKLSRRHTLRLRLRNYPGAFTFRPGTSDYAVVSHIFVAGEYDWLREPAPATIIDCGANIGGTAFAFLSRFPHARLVALEPDEDNHAVLASNLEQFSDRAVALHAAVWSHDTTLRVVRGEHLDGSEWTYQAKEHPDSKLPPVAAKSIPTIMADAGFETVDLLKIDIEGGELELFSHGDCPWLERVKNISIELHGSECRDAFFSALEPYDYELEQHGELTACLDMRVARD